ncbi:MAG: hydroxyacylglutathione hydrolase [Pseudomonadota bacterium]
MMPLTIKQFPCFSDNYGYLIRDEQTGVVAAIDTPEADKINAGLNAEGWRLDLILNTHHHFDHTGGNLALKEHWNCEIIGPRNEAEKIPGIDRAVGEGDTIAVGNAKADVFDTPGHTAGHIVYYFAEEAAAFVGDTIFALGCGRLFEGTAEQMWTSLSKIKALPQETLLYCAHEYTEANARFALSIEPDHPGLKARAAAIAATRAKGASTVPTSVAEECATSPFLRADDPALRTALGMTNASDLDVFTEVRHRKDNF